MKILAVPNLVLLAVAAIGCAVSAPSRSAPLVLEFNDGSTTTPVVTDNTVFYTDRSTIKALKWEGIQNFVTPFATSYTTGGPMNPLAVGVLMDGRSYVFGSSTDGKAYKLDIANSALAGVFTIAKTNGVNQISDLRRASSLACAVKDSLGPISLAPGVDIGGGSLRDIAVVGTVHGCESTTTNRVIGLDASDITGTPVWTFNGGGEYSIDEIQGCAVSDSLVFCSTRLRTGAFQNTLWAIDLKSGQAVWALNAGNFTAAPTFAPATANLTARVYVNAGTSVMAIDAATGAVIWQQPFPLTSTIFIGAPAIGFDGTVVVTMYPNTVTSLLDSGDSGNVLWTTHLVVINQANMNVARVSAPAVDPDTGNIYVTANDGYVHEIQPSTGRELSKRLIDRLLASNPPENPAPVQPSIDGQVGQRYLTAFTAGNGFTTNDGWRYPLPFSSTDTTPPVIIPSIAGNLVNKRWYNSDVVVSWSVTDPESPISATTGCDSSSITTDTISLMFTCSATSVGGTATQSVTIKRDATPPTITFSGNAGTYGADQSVSITCSATDATAGIASSTCQSITGPAYSFNIGANTFSATASDNAGNNSTASTTFTVTATVGTLFNLANPFVDGSAQYLALPARQRAIVDGILALLNRALASLKPGTNAVQKSIVINIYKLGIAALAQAGYLNSSQVGILNRIASAL